MVQSGNGRARLVVARTVKSALVTLLKVHWKQRAPPGAVQAELLRRGGWLAGAHWASTAPMSTCAPEQRG